MCFSHSCCSKKPIFFFKTQFNCSLLVKLTTSLPLSPQRHASFHFTPVASFLHVLSCPSYSIATSLWLFTFPLPQSFIFVALFCFPQHNIFIDYLRISHHVSQSHLLPSLPRSTSHPLVTSEHSFMFLKITFRFYFLLVTILPACMSLYHMSAQCSWKSKEGHIPWNWSYRMIMNHQHIGAVNWIQVYCKRKRCSYLLSHLSSPHSDILNGRDPALFMLI